MRLFPLLFLSRGSKVSLRGEKGGGESETTNERAGGLPLYELAFSHSSHRYVIPMAGVDKYLIFLLPEAISHPGGFTAGVEKKSSRFWRLGDCAIWLHRAVWWANIPHEPLLPEVHWTPVKSEAHQGPRIYSGLTLAGPVASLKVHPSPLYFFVCPSFCLRSLDTLRGAL